MVVTEQNLDRISAEMGFKLAENFESKDDARKLETLVTKALGVLVEDGLFAYIVWLKSRSEKEEKYCMKIIEFSSNLLKDERIALASKDDNSKDLQDMALDISTDIQKTLLARQLLERMLTYARYRAKALQKGD